ncbi:hydroxyglutarate oxidase [Streptomyces griseoruber]|uniref:Hydroxyglutarate oxidase n=1 Tax=Streptomyces griseoruber TaxID=1943 RepID=A0A124I2U0_9ACTN|nr:L-2-hydroxyglutarate oxidase [Streptomyces griseoruber]KUN81641.1 hydroxyglutarate oxidase [Streptomyces griseoruber]
MEVVQVVAYDCDVLVVGGGIVGLSTAYAITRSAPGTRVTVLEKEPGPARHQTGRNSGVIHSGIYYRPGSLKARYAVRGAAEMTKFCAEYGIAHAVTGKLIVATERDELPRLHGLVQRGRENGIPVRELGTAQIAEYEPEVRGLAAIHVGTTGICDYTAVAHRLGEASGAEIRYGAEVVRIDRRPERGVAVLTARGDVVRGRALVNCAGLYCDEIARMTGDEPEVRIVPFRGEYYELARPDLVRGLVYPVPDPAFPFLGVHLTRGIDGGVHVGPNAVPALAREGYDWGVVRPREALATAAWPGVWRMGRRHWRYGAGELRRSVSKGAFVQAVRRLLPAVREADLVRAEAGVRAQAVLRDGGLVDDFLIREGARAVHVLNAPSPAATASLPIGREVARRALEVLGTR